MEKRILSHSEWLLENKMFSGDKKCSLTNKIFFHGRKEDVDKLEFPIWVTTSKLRSMTFAIAMRYDEIKKRNKYTTPKIGESGFVYDIKFTGNAIQKSMPNDEFILLDGEIEIISKKEVIATKKPGYLSCTPTWKEKNNI